LHFESVLHLRGSEPRLLVWDAIPLQNEDGQPFGLAAIGRDITAERALEAQLAHARRLDSIGRLAAGISHDFNNLLMLIVGNVSLLMDKIDPREPAYESLQLVKSAADDCAALTQQLLEIGRGQRLRPEVVSLNALVTAEQTTLRAMVGASVDVIVYLDPDAGMVNVDAGQIRRILANLVTNARDAMPEGGTVKIATFNVDIGDEPSSDFPDVARGAYVALTVSDTGVGLTDEVREHMFDPFFTTKDMGKGTGLGLATVYGFVSQSGGYISAAGTPGTGATMRILFPRVGSSAAEGSKESVR
jgi:two-component system, cell cycle sensor histidine kinase and response regulator CckA